MADTPSQSQTGLEVLTAADLAKAPASSSKLPNITNQSVLDDMQKLYEQKQAEKNYFMQDLADASAWWSGGAAGPSSGLALRAQVRAQQAKDLQDLQMALSQGKVNLAQLGEANEALKPGAQALSGVPAGTTGAGGERMVPYRGVMIPEKVYRVIQTYISAGNKPEADKKFAEYVGEETKFITNPNAYEQKDYFDERTGEQKRRSAMDIRGGTPSAQPSAVAPVAPAVQPSVAPPAVQPTVARPTAAVPSQEGDVYRFENLSDETKARLSATAKNQLGLNNDVMNRTDIAELFNKAPLEQRKAAFMQSGEKPVVSTQTQAQAPAPTMAPAVATVAPTEAPKTYSQYKTEQAGREKYAEQESTAVGKAAGERRAALENLRPDLGLKLKNANSLLTILDETPEAVGIAYRGPATGGVIEAAKQGKIPLIGKTDVEELLATQLSPQARANRAKFDSIAAAVVAEERRNLAKGTGTVSNYETEQFAKATGLDKKSPAEANRYFAVFIAENLRAKAKLIDELDKNPKQNMADFERSPRYKEIMAERDNRLEKLFPELANRDAGFGPKAPTKGASDDELENWKKRYGTKKEIK